MPAGNKSALKQERKASLRARNPPKDSKFPELKNGYPDSYSQELADSDAFHADPNQPETSLLTSGDHYSYRGPRFIFQDEPRMKIYNDFNRSVFSTASVLFYLKNGRRVTDEPPLYVTASREKWMRVAAFPEQGSTFPGERGNFSNLSPNGQRHPYPWQAHHLIPQSVFFEKNSPFDDDMMMVLKRSFYNINNGHNIIMLPADPKYSPVHRLSAHFSDHPAYTLQLKARMKEVATALKKIFNEAKRTKKHLALFKAILKAFHTLEDEFWSFVIILSNAAAAVAFGVIKEEDIHAYGGIIKFWTTNAKGMKTRHLFGVIG
ncbi:AHH domain-containing protein [Corallococcus sp. bb12-1]|uniref:AHH domain-containing protein n=1 Tax=Corallococcus sp. bb12-1 TaxID=2996784 RepID=UPI0022720884|nr:AHH domain-containing protein [Corallococcus sp. bb12-1]MCY1040751.1 AHH domain-containing protein [Corallococcus sp. bb12-1]